MAHSATNLVKANKTIESQDRRLAKDKQSAKTLEGAFVRKSVSGLTAGAYGTMKRMGVSNTVKGFPWKLGVFSFATLVEAMSKGMVQSAAAGVADMTFGIYLHDAIASGSLIAGEDEDASGEI